ncbi:uncharacterized protein LOC144436064 isoform X3 [Glandiceps talaboti]
MANKGITKTLTMANTGLCISLLLLAILSVHAAPTRQERDTDKRDASKREIQNDKRVFWVEKKDAAQAADVDKRVFWVEKKDAGLHGDFEADKRVFWVEKKDAGSSDNKDKRVFWVERKDAAANEGKDKRAGNDKRVFWVEKKDAKADDQKRVFWVEKKDAAADKDKRVFWVEKKDADMADALYESTLVQTELILDCYKLMCVDDFKECSASCNEKGSQPACFNSCKEGNRSCVDYCSKVINAEETKSELSDNDDNLSEF